MLRSRFRWVSVLTLLGIVSAVGCEHEQPKLAPMKPPRVLISLPTASEITDFEDFTGRTDAVKTVEIRARVTGYLEKLFFEDGKEVKEGDKLFEIDARPYKAELDRTEASVVQSEAHQKRLDADHRRAMSLFNRGAISREEVDRIAGDFTEAVAAVGMSKAARDLAKLNLEFTKVTAPIAGRTSRRLVDPGNLVKADETSLTTIVAVDPMYVYFDIDERTMLKFRRLIQEKKIRSREEGAEIPIMVELSDEVEFPRKGMINFSDNKVDPSTGTLRVRGSIPNPKPRVLSPGMFVRVRVPIGVAHQAILISEQALGTDQGRKFVYVVNGKNEVVHRDVKVGSLNQGKRVIVEGLSPGEKVIVSGLQRVRPGVKVDPQLAEGSLRAGEPAAAGVQGERAAADGKPPQAEGAAPVRERASERAPVAKAAGRAS